MRTLRVIFAVGDEQERRSFSALVAGSACELAFPLNIAEVEAIYSRDEADAIVTDFHFHNGALADWLTFWPLPAVLVVDPGDEPERIERTTRDEASVFVERRPDGGHLRLLPILIRKVIGIRESVKRQNAHLQMTEHQYLNLLQAIPDIVYILDGEGRFIYLNDAVKSLGYDPGHLIGKHFSEIVHPADVAKVSRVAVLESLHGVVTGPEAAPKLFDERRSGSRMTKNLELRLRLAPGADLGQLPAVVDSPSSSSSRTPLSAGTSPGTAPGSGVKDAGAKDAASAAAAWEVAYGKINAYGEVSCTGFQLPEFEGRSLGTLGIIRDVSLRKAQERELVESLAARELRLKEIHHRVKNNLQVVSSLLNLQESALVEEKDRAIFLDCQTQIQSMAMVHEELYRGGDLQRIDMQKYFGEFIDYLAGMYDGTVHGVSWSVEAPQVTLDLDEAIPVALIVNELVSNCFKHAFPSDRGGRVRIALEPRGENWLLTVSDDGRGFSASRSGTARTGIGTELVGALAAQLKGNVEMADEAGAVVRVAFPRH
ncbi:MAG TPA: histidine kinase dimerization/phosphoacceptor domain -containing protein [Rectinemataceae bacterium]|nr:histidine kinase dimerization/phosphoacceptor domain -containing protein [Rectinemataceae bacterium]